SYAGAQLADVDCLGQIHFEQSALAEGQRHCVLRLLFGFTCVARSKLGNRRTRAFHYRVVADGQAGSVDLLRHLVSMSGGIALHDLHAAAMAMHIAEAADVHQDVEAELLPGAEGARNFVMTAAMTQAQIDDLSSLRF